MLTFEDVGHDAAALNPLPGEAWDAGTFANYAEAVWDTIRMNNVAQHFATAFFGLHLRGDEAMAPYLDLAEDAGAFTSDHTDWRGFQERTALGLRFERRAPTGE